MNKPYGCGYWLVIVLSAVFTGAIFGAAIIYFNLTWWVVVGSILLVAGARLAMDFYQLNIKGEGDVDDAEDR